MNIDLFKSIRVNVLETLTDLLPDDRWRFSQFEEDDGRTVTYFLGHKDPTAGQPVMFARLAVDTTETSRRVRIVTNGNTSHEYTAEKIALTLKPPFNRAVKIISGRMQQVTLSARASELRERVTGDAVSKIVLIGGEEAISGAFQIPPAKLEDKQALHDIVRALRALHKALAS